MFDDLSADISRQAERGNIPPVAEEECFILPQPLE
jgi:hypothetical protein